MWSAVNSVFNLLFDAVFWPLGWLSPTLQLCAVGVPAGIFALIVYRYVSDQEGIEAAKDKIKAHLLELRLYKDDLRVTLSAQRKILRYNATYLRHALLPMAVMIGPFLLMIVQIETRFALRSLEPGETALLTVALTDEQRPSELDARLELPDGVIQETPALRIDETREIVWRVRAAVDGEFIARVWLGEESIAKRIVVNGQKTHVSSSVYRGNDLNALAYPAEGSLPNDSSVRAIHLDYPESRGFYLGLSSATWIFFAASMAAGFALRGPLGVTF